VRSTDLLSLPNVNPDAGFAVQMSIEENLVDMQSVSFQAALLYTSSKGILSGAAGVYQKVSFFCGIYLVETHCICPKYHTIPCIVPYFLPGLKRLWL
jgi:hypothetical protein